MYRELSETERINLQILSKREAEVSLSMTFVHTPTKEGPYDLPESHPLYYVYAISRKSLNALRVPKDTLNDVLTAMHNELIRIASRQV
jgi:hypothetical protein